VKPVALTPGEPAGIGPDIVLKLAQMPLDATPVAIADPELLRQRAEALGLDIELQTGPPAAEHRPGTLYVAPCPLRRPVATGILNPENATYVLETLRRGVQGCRAGDYHALVTGPVHKSNITASGTAFSGHTEYLGELTGARPVMMLVAGRLRVALLTTHLPLRAVADAVTADNLEAILRILHRDLTRWFALADPRIAVTGLNPHAGESGQLGREEIEVIEPVLRRLRDEGLKLTGPLPADTAFTPPQLEHCDAVLAMYHDQGLPVLKHAGFGTAVNITLGLPIIRTSVDHGTALDLAGTGRAEAGSLRAAFELAVSLKND
jgi:4-hydroxythreonine-4-phosphate dehydrogenase